MHESVALLQNLIAEDREAVRFMEEALERAEARGTTLINQARVQEQIRAGAKRISDLTQLIDEYAEAERDGEAAGAAHKLAVLQVAAATYVEAKQIAEAADGR